MAKEENKKFELVALDSKNLKELDGFETKLNELVENNPFVEITDNKSYNEAKKARTALLKGRTEIQGQDKLIGSFLSKFRKDTMAIAKNLIDIVSPHEDKQQEEIDRWEKKKEEEKQAKAKAEEERKERLLKEANEVGEKVEELFDNLTLENIDETKEKFEELALEIEDKDFEEYQVVVDDHLNGIGERFDNVLEALKAEEDSRIEAEKEQQDHLILSLKESAYEVNKEQTLDNYDEIVERTNKIFEPYNPKGTFYDELLKKYSRVKSQCYQDIDDRMLQLVKERQDDIKDWIEARKETATDLILSANVENFEAKFADVQKIIDAGCHYKEHDPEIWSLAVSQIQRSLDQKKEFIELKLVEVKREKEKKEEIATKRREQIRALDLKKYQKQGADIDYCEAELMNFTEEDWSEEVAKIETAIEEFENKRKHDQARERRLRNDRKKLNEHLENIRATVLSCPELKNEETIIFIGDVEVELLQKIDEIEQRIDKI